MCRSCVYRVQHSHCVEQASQDIGRPREEVCLTPKADVECLQWIRPLVKLCSVSIVCLSCVCRVSIVCLSCGRHLLNTTPKADVECYEDCLAFVFLSCVYHEHSHCSEQASQDIGRPRGGVSFVCRSCVYRVQHSHCVEQAS